MPDNDYAPSPDWNYWRAHRVTTLAEAIALSIGVDPQSFLCAAADRKYNAARADAAVLTGNLGRSFNPDVYIVLRLWPRPLSIENTLGRSFDERAYVVAKDALQGAFAIDVPNLNESRISVLLEYVDLYEVVKWCAVKHFEVPPEFAALIEQHPDEGILQIKDAGASSSTILNMVEPKNKHDWFFPIKDCIQQFEKKNNRTPSATELWTVLRTSPPAQYGIKNEKKRGREGVTLAEYKHMDRSALGKMYRRLYPTPKTSHIEKNKDKFAE